MNVWRGFAMPSGSTGKSEIKAGARIQICHPLLGTGHGKSPGVSAPSLYLGFPGNLSEELPGEESQEGVIPPPWAAQAGHVGGCEHVVHEHGAKAAAVTVIPTQDKFR